ncbi:MAG: DNA polymerase I [Coriobacteriales bacterium]|jgi:DNA polymerase-1
MRRIAVIDGNSLMHRAFHAVPTYMMTSDGRHTNAVFGFVSMLLKMIEEFNPDGIICAFDAGIPQFRFDAVEIYKAQRPPMDPDLKEQFPMIEKLLGAMRIPVVKLEGWEGDDVLGTLSKMGDEAGIETYLVSGDRDIFQLCSETTKVVATKKGLSDVIVYGPAEVKERYGVTPEQVPDFIALRGDPSDNIPGVPGIGEKTAAKLLGQYGSADSIVEHQDELKGKVRQNIHDNVDRLNAGRTVATIVRDLDVDIDLESVKFPDFDPKEVVDAFKELNITSHVSKILALQDDSNSSSHEDPETEVKMELVPEGESVAFVDELVSSGAVVALVPEKIGGDNLFDDGYKLAVCDGEKATVLRGEAINSSLARFVSSESNTIVVPDSKDMLQELIPQDSSKESLIEIGSVDPSRIFDLSIAGYLLDSSVSSYGLEYLAMEYLGVQLKTKEKPKKGADPEELTDDELTYRAGIAFRLRDVLEKKLSEDGSLDCYRKIEMPLVPVLVMLERAGLEMDVDRLHELADQIGDEIEGLSSQIYAEAGEEFNLGSPKQLSHILFEKLGLKPKKKTRSGYSTDASVLTSLAAEGDSPVPGLVLEYRELSKIKSTYLDTLPDMRLGDGRLHTSFNQTVTATGRLSSSDPNLQNIPVRTELGRQIRTAFVPYKEMTSDGKEAVFLSADYSQIELRLLAHLSGDEGLIDAFKHGSDFHRSTAARIFGVEFEDVTPEMRSRAKAVNFGIVYGQQAFGLSRSLHISMAEAQGMIDRYFSAYPQVKVYLNGLVSQVKEKGWVETMFGRKRHVPEIHSSNQSQRMAGERVAMNHPMQGSAADIIKLAMINVSRRLQEEKFESVMLLQIHDELDFSCPKGEIEKLSKMVVEEMSGVCELSVPLEVSVSYGPTWADAK